MNTVTDLARLSEKEKYERAWSHPEYRLACHSLLLWNVNRDWFPFRFKNAIDLGCGLGHLVAVWNDQGIEAYGLDITSDCLHPNVLERWGHRFIEACLWHFALGQHFEFGICTDVMEHIPPTHVDRTLECMAAHCDEILFKVAHSPSLFHGDTLHLTLQPASWWVSVMESVGGSAQFLGSVTRSGFRDSIIRWRP